MMKQPKNSDLRVDMQGTKDLRAKISKSKKIKITINIDEDILEVVRQHADESGVPYQKLVNRLLREVLSDKNSESKRLEELEKEIKGIKKKLSA